MTDRELLHEYLEYKSDTAFVDLVRRHIDLVYGVAIRECRDPSLARASTQDTFSLLARTAASIETDGSVVLWLFDRARGIARNALDREMRDLPVVKTNPSLPGGWAALEPLLNDAVDALIETDREGVLLYCFLSRDLPEIAEEIGWSKEAARALIIDRGLASMCAWLGERKLQYTVSELELVLKERATPASGMPASTVAETALGSKSDPSTKREPHAEPKPRRSPAPLIAAIATVTVVVVIGLWFINVQPAAPMPKLVPPPVAPPPTAISNDSTQPPPAPDQSPAMPSTASNDTFAASTSAAPPPPATPLPKSWSTVSRSPAIAQQAPSASAPPSPAGVSSSVPPPSNVRLLGVSMGQQPYAAMEVDGQERIVKQGDSIGDGQVTAIASDHVTVTLPDGRWVNVPIGSTGGG